MTSHVKIMPPGEPPPPPPAPPTGNTPPTRREIVREIALEMSIRTIESRSVWDGTLNTEDIPAAILAIAEAYRAYLEGRAVPGKAAFDDDPLGDR